MVCSISAELLNPSQTLEKQLIGLRDLLLTILPAIAKKVVEGGVQNYTINTGQTIQTVRVDSMADLISNYRNILAIYNELIQHLTGSNFTALRDESAFWYGRGRY